jgi:hypothetical protein
LSWTGSAFACGLLVWGIPIALDLRNDPFLAGQLAVAGIVAVIVAVVAA